MSQYCAPKEVHVLVKEVLLRVPGKVSPGESPLSPPYRCAATRVIRIAPSATRIMKQYLLGLRLAWWNSGVNDLLTFFFVWPVTIPLTIMISLVQTFQFTYLFLRRQDVHRFYWEMIDRSGLYKCHLHDKVFRDECI
jgi:hypothetical protein